MEWVLCKQNATFRLGNAPIVQIDLTQHEPTILCDGREYYASDWKRTDGSSGVIQEWGYRTGPIKSILVWTDRENNKWLKVYWRF